MSSEVISRAPAEAPLPPPAAAETVIRSLDDAKTYKDGGRSGRVIIEVAGVCQATCPYCAQNSGKARRKEVAGGAYMPVELFRDIIAHLRSSVAFVKKVDRVYLYNWGEPFLCPAINEYLEILKSHGLHAVISSNFQKVPVIRPENLPVITEVLFSLSGMTQDTYGRIHGGQIDKVLKNFEGFLAELKQHAPKTQVFMAWHRYRFNEHQFWPAYNYSRAQGVGFIPSVAFLNDLAELIQAASDKMPAERKSDAERDLYFSHMVNSFHQYRDGADLYDCPAWDDVVVDEQGRLLICCGTDAKTSVGTVFNTTYDEMRQKKIASALCKVCKVTGVAEWAHNNHHDRNQLPWPGGGGMSALRLRLSYDKHKLKNDVRHALTKVAFGETILDVYRKLRHS